MVMKWVDVSDTGAVPEGVMLGKVIGGVEIALYQIDGSFYATSNICTHAFARLSEGYLDGDCVECPIHQALFHVPTGQARSTIAKRPLQTFPVKVEEGRLLVEMPAD